MVCQFCGVFIDNGEHFCPACGQNNAPTNNPNVLTNDPNMNNAPMHDPNMNNAPMHDPNMNHAPMNNPNMYNPNVHNPNMYNPYMNHAPMNHNGIAPGLQCSKCNSYIENGKAFCSNCGNSIKAESEVKHFIPLICAGVAFVFFSILGGDYFLQEVNLFDYLTIPVSLAGIICAFVMIPRGRTALKVISCILNGFFLLGALGWVFM